MHICLKLIVTTEAGHTRHKKNAQNGSAHSFIHRHTLQRPSIARPLMIVLLLSISENLETILMGGDFNLNEIVSHRT